MHFTPISRHPRLSPSPRHRGISHCVIWPRLLAIMHHACSPVLTILTARRDGRSGTATATADDSSHPSPPLQGNQRSAWVINRFKLLNGHQSHLKQCYWHPKQTVASVCAGDGGKEAGEEVEENDPLDDESDGWADACLTHAGIKCSWRVDEILRTDWLWHSWQHASDCCHYMRFRSKKQKMIPVFFCPSIIN